MHLADLHKIDPSKISICKHNMALCIFEAILWFLIVINFYLKHKNIFSLHQSSIQYLKLSHTVLNGLKYVGLKLSFDVLSSELRRVQQNYCNSQWKPVDALHTIVNGMKRQPIFEIALSDTVIWSCRNTFLCLTRLHNYMWCLLEPISIPSIGINIHMGSRLCHSKFTYV